jgi:hypothetical protein
VSLNPPTSSNQEGTNIVTKVSLAKIEKFVSNRDGAKT